MNTFKTGTTTLGVIAKDSIILGADKQATMGHIKADEKGVKIYKINDDIALTIAGGQADAQFLIRHLTVRANLYELEHKKHLNVKSATTLLANILNLNKMYFMAQFLLAGNKPDLALYTMDVAGGINKEDKFAFSGSGSEFALSVLDSEYKPNMSTEKAIELVRKAITSAKKRDIYTGGEGIYLLIIKKDSIEERHEKFFS